MKRITTPVLCLLLGLIMTFAILVDVSGAIADSWDGDDDRPAYRQNTWHHQTGHHQTGHHGKGHGHKHKHHHRHKHHQGNRVGGVAYDYDNCEHEEYDNRPIDIRPKATTVWRNPPAPIAQRQTTWVPTEEISGTGPCREYHTTARIGGREQQIYGQACRQPDGAWKFEPDQN